jgi:hypothetical protein
MLVGEHGPEVIVPTQDITVVPNPGDQPSVFYGPDGRPYANTAAGPAPLTPPQREMKAFRRDTPAQQHVVTQAYNAGLARAADAQMATYQKQLAQGPAVVRDEGEIDQAPPGWLSDYMATQQPVMLAAREEGGPVEAGQPVIVGENGPEYVAPAIASTLPPPRPPRLEVAPRPMTMSQAAIARMLPVDEEEGDEGPEADEEATIPGALPPPDQVKIARMAMPQREMKTFTRMPSPEQEQLAQEAAIYRRGEQWHNAAALQSARDAMPVTGLGGGYIMTPVVGPAMLGAAAALRGGAYATGQVAKQAEAKLGARKK